MRWSAEEDMELEQLCGEYPWPIVVEKYLAWAEENGYQARTAGALVRRAGTLRCPRKANGLFITIGMVSEILGIDREKPRRWIRQGGLRAYRRSDRKPSPYYVSRSSLRRWAKRNPTLFRCYSRDALMALFDDPELADEIHALPFVAARTVRRAVRCVDTGEVYRTMGEAARANYVTVARMGAVINTHERANGKRFTDVVPRYGS
jgi:excisionase family DNA binding protein